MRTLAQNSGSANILEESRGVKIVVDENDYSYISTGSTRVAYLTFLDLTIIRFPMCDFRFLQSAESPNEELFIKSSTWSKPCPEYASLQDLKGHTYHFGKVGNKYDLYLVFEPKRLNCRCKEHNSEMHVCEEVRKILADLIDDSFHVLPASTHYYASDESNTYLSSNSGFNVKFYQLNTAILQFDRLQSIPFFDSHTPYWIITCLGQNDIVGDNWNAPLLSDLQRYFCLDQRDYLKVAIAINVNSVDPSPKSVILPEIGFLELIDNDADFRYEQYSKAFQSDFSNYQSKMCPPGLASLLRQSDDYEYVSLNWYNGMF